MGLRYDAAGLMKDVIGAPAGLEREALEAYAGRLEAARDAVVAMHEDGTLGFLDLPERDVLGLKTFAQEVVDAGFTDQVIFGIGGSSLGASAVLGPMHPGEGSGVRTHISENIDPVTFRVLMDGLDLTRTLFIVISKSGTTVETMSKFWCAFDALCAHEDIEDPGRHVVAITDPQGGALRKMVDAHGFRSFPVAPNVGGRFSVLTEVGLVPLAIAGYDIEGLLAGAASARDEAKRGSVLESATLQAAAHFDALYQSGIRQVVMMSYSDQLLGMADWFRQLWAESLGKRLDRDGNVVHVGITPLKASGVIDQHSQVQLYVEGPLDKHIAFLEVEDFGAQVMVPMREGLPPKLGHLQGKDLGQLLAAELEGTRLALTQAGRPTSRWLFSSITPGEVGAFIMAWEIITALVGELWNINAFDQPGVELGKRIAHGLLGREDLAHWAAQKAEAVASGEPARWEVG
ncbi:MAG: glucose-6-phosphate isomerase [Myxococcota bacterium]